MRLTQKGQVTVPKRLRDRFGMKTGTEVEFKATEAGVLIRPARADQAAKVREVIESVRGTATAGFTTDEIMAMTRD